MITDPYKKVISDTYNEYCTSNLKFQYWKHKKIYCPICDSHILYPRSSEHKYTKKHENNLKKKLKRTIERKFMKDKMRGGVKNKLVSVGQL